MGVPQGSLGLCVGNDHLHSRKYLQKDRTTSKTTSQLQYCVSESVCTMPYLPRLHQWQAVRRPPLYQANPEELQIDIWKRVRNSKLYALKELLLVNLIKKGNGSRHFTITCRVLGLSCLRKQWWGLVRLCPGEKPAEWLLEGVERNKCNG